MANPKPLQVAALSVPRQTQRGQGRRTATTVNLLPEAKERIRAAAKVQGYETFTTFIVDSMDMITEAVESKNRAAFNKALREIQRGAH